jgi:hypothetical protein
MALFLALTLPFSEIQVNGVASYQDATSISF